MVLTGRVKNMGFILGCFIGTGIGYLLCSLCYQARISDMLSEIRAQCKKCFNREYEEGMGV